MNNTTILFLVLGLSICEAVATKFTNLKCESLDANWVVFTQCRLKLIRRGVVSLNVYATVLKPATNIKLNFDLYKRGNGLRPFLFNTTVDFCDIQKKQNGNLPIKVIHNFLRNYSNLNHTCPIDHDIVVKDLLLTEEKFRLIPLPHGDYMIVLNFLVDDIPKVSIKIYYSWDDKN